MDESGTGVSTAGSPPTGAMDSGGVEMASGSSSGCS